MEIKKWKLASKANLQIFSENCFFRIVINQHAKKNIVDC